MKQDTKLDDMANTLHRLLGMILVMILLMAGVGIGRVANAASSPAVETDIVALSYDMAGERLLKVHPRHLFARADGDETWQAIALPNSMMVGQLATAVAPPTAEGILYIAGPGIGVLRSDNDGESWQSLNESLPDQNVTAFTVHRQQPETLYAVLSGDGIYRSEDAGQSWRKMDGGPRQAIRRLLHSDLPGSMQTGWLYAVSDDAVRLSMDCFCGWRPTGEMDAGTVHDVTYDPREPESVYVAAEHGIFHSDNGGREWQLISDGGPEKMALTFASSAGLLYAATIEGEILRREDLGKSWE